MPTHQKSGPMPGSVPPEMRCAGERRVAEPAAVRRTAEEEARVHEDAAEEDDPVAEHVQPREGDVAAPRSGGGRSSSRSATDSGMTMRKIIVVPCMVNIVLYCAAVRTVPLGRASCRRISSASTPPTTKNPSAVAP